MTPEEALDLFLSAHVAPGAPVGLAVSGGGDSTALLHAAASLGGPFRVATVDHALRPGSAAEAAAVASACASLGLPHDTLRWGDWDGRGNLQAAARDARRRLLADWARAGGLPWILLGHTADDQAETVLLRLARGSGVDGLAGMAEAVRAPRGVTLGRPFLRLGREELRGWLRAQDVAWIEDPSNDDERFDRVRARRLLAELAPLGLTRERLLRTAGHMARARAALDGQAAAEAARAVREGPDGSLLLPAALLGRLASDDVAARLLAAALMWAGGRSRRPRWDALARLAATVGAGRAATLWGCRVSPEGGPGGGEVRVAPEPGRARPRTDRPPFRDFVAGGEGDLR